LKANAVAAKGCSDFTTVMYEAFHMLYRDEEVYGKAQNMYNIFCGKLREDDLTKDFLTSKDLQIRKFKHIILDSARLALHISID
jgi:hypothetical protein